MLLFPRALITFPVIPPEIKSTLLCLPSRVFPSESKISRLFTSFSWPLTLFKLVTEIFSARAGKSISKLLIPIPLATSTLTFFSHFTGFPRTAPYCLTLTCKVVKEPLEMIVSWIELFSKVRLLPELIGRLVSFKVSWIELFWEMGEVWFSSTDGSEIVWFWGEVEESEEGSEVGISTGVSITGELGSTGASSVGKVVTSSITGVVSIGTSEEGVVSTAASLEGVKVSSAGAGELSMPKSSTALPMRELKVLAKLCILFAALVVLFSKW